MKTILYILAGSLLLLAFSITQSDTNAVSQKTFKTSQLQSPDPDLFSFVNHIKAVDNHAHPNSIDPDDEDADALPLYLLLPFDIPARLRPNSPDWLEAYKALYGFKGNELNEQAMESLTLNVDDVRTQQKDNFPSWILDQVGTDVMLANRVSMGPGLDESRFKWVSFVDAFMFPLSTKAEAERTPDRQALFPAIAHHVDTYIQQQGLRTLPNDLETYQRAVVTATLEQQKKQGCVAVKFEAGFLRSLEFGHVSFQKAGGIYSRYIHGGVPSREEYKALQDYLFRYIAGEAGRLGLAVHIHAFPGPGKYYLVAETDPLLLESVIKDPSLQGTNFVLIHGGGPFVSHTDALLWNSNVYADISALTRIWTATQLATVLRNWLSQYPEKILYGTDAASFGPGLGWELGAWIAAGTARQALAIALSDMIASHEISEGRAKEIATMVMRSNAINLYDLHLDSNNSE